MEWEKVVNYWETLFFVSGFGRKMFRCGIFKCIYIYIYIEIYVFKFTYRSRKELHKKRSKEKRKHPGKTPCKRISEFQQCFQERTPVSRFEMMDTLILPTFEVYLLNLVPSHFPAYWLSRTIHIYNTKKILFHCSTTVVYLHFSNYVYMFFL